MHTITRRTALKLGAAGAAMMAAAGPAAVLGQTTGGGGTLRIAMTTSDVPTTSGTPDNGSEGGRFAGFTIYDALVQWDFTRTDAPALLTGGLATEWHIDPNDNKRWVFTIRQDVMFHDGTPLTVDDIVWNFDRQFKKDSPQFDDLAASYGGAYIASIASYEKTGDWEFVVHTKNVFSMLPYQLALLFIVSPRQFDKVNHDWLAFRSQPVGTGPFKVTKVTPHVSLELVPNTDYWDKNRISKLDALVLLPIADANTRVAALRSGQVDWIEFPDPDSIPALQGAGFDVITKPYLHVWTWVLNCKSSPALQDVRVRQALNYAVDRDGMCALLNNTAIPAIGLYNDDYKLFGNPTQRYSYDVDKAKQMLTEAGYGPDKPLTLKVMLPTAGSGNMIPIPMCQFIQQSLADVGVNCELEVADWGTVTTAMRQDPDDPAVPHRDVICHGQPFGDPTRFYNNDVSPQAGGTGNWGWYKNDEVDALLKGAFSTFDPAEIDAKLAEAHAKVVDDAPNIFVVHDLNPRAISPKVKGFVQAQSWYQDFTQITVDA